MSVENNKEKRIPIEELQATARKSLMNLYKEWYGSPFDSVVPVEEQYPNSHPLDKAIEIGALMLTIWEQIPEIEEYMKRTSHVDIKAVDVSQGVFLGPNYYYEEIRITKEGVWHTRHLDWNGTKFFGILDPKNLEVSWDETIASKSKKFIKKLAALSDRDIFYLYLRAIDSKPRFARIREKFNRR